LRLLPLQPLHKPVLLPGQRSKPWPDRTFAAPTKTPTRRLAFLFSGIRNPRLPSFLGHRASPGTNSPAPPPLGGRSSARRPAYFSVDIVSEVGNSRNRKKIIKK
jgi:hypothetical protein